MKIGDIVRKKQPDVYRKLMKISNNKGKNAVAYVDYKKMMEDVPVYKRHNGAWRQVRHG